MFLSILVDEDEQVMEQVPCQFGRITSVLGFSRLKRRRLSSMDDGFLNHY